jgi:Chaperone of endosialidase
MCRKGLSGDNNSINFYNFFWTGNALHCWVDDKNVGTVSGLPEKRLKDNISAMPKTALAKLMQLKPVTFRYKNILGTVFTASQLIQEGFVADELQQVIPSVLQHNPTFYP